MHPMEEQFGRLTKKQRKELRKQEKLEMRAEAVRSQRLSRLFWWGLGIAAVLVFVILFAKAASTPSTSQTPPPEVNQKDWTKGASEGSASATLIEYSDFQCPACKVYQPLLGQVLSAFPEKLRFVYRHFPLRTTHKNAQLAAQAAEAAGKQGKFWQMHDMLFDKQDSWSKLPNPKDTFIEYAQVLELDKDKFRTDLDLAEIAQKIDADLSGGEAAGVDATPTFYLNGQKVENIKGLEDFKKRVEDAINQPPVTP